MSLATLVNGADCGPLNPLQGLTKNLDSDRGLQQVHATGNLYPSLPWMLTNIFTGLLWGQQGWFFARRMLILVRVPVHSPNSASVVDRYSVRRRPCLRALGRMLRVSSLQVKERLQFPL
jgi:hypothetical protein